MVTDCMERDIRNFCLASSKVESILYESSAAVSEAPIRTCDGLIILFAAHG